MAVEKRLAYSIVQFLRDQTHSGALNSDEQESLEGNVQSLWASLYFTLYSLNIEKIQVFIHRKNIHLS